MKRKRTLRALYVAAILVGSCAWAEGASAQETPAQRQAQTHFQRAVTLYSEADYRAALVEFKRAYEMAPHVTVLYNLGQTYYQLQNYAEALTTFERFLAEGGTAHRQEVENAVAVLRTRVGKVDISTPSPGWEIAIDDENVGRTPLARPIAVSIGRRRVTATKAGEPTASKFVEVAAGETAAVILGAPASPVATAEPRPKTPPREEAADTKHGETPTASDGLLIAGWTTTGVLAAAGVVTGIFALSSASKLKDAREAFPADRADVDDRGSKTTTLSVATDVLFGAALVAGGVSLYLTLTRPSSSTHRAAPPGGGARVGFTGSRVVFEGSF